MRIGGIAPMPRLTYINTLTDAAKSCGVAAFVFRRNDQRAEERQADLAAVRVAAHEKIDAAVVDQVDEVGMVRHADARSALHSRERGLDVRLAAIDLVDADDRQLGAVAPDDMRLVDDELHALRGHRGLHFVAVRPVVVIAEDGQHCRRAP